jgi:hypothetical protein
MSACWTCVTNLVLLYCSGTQCLILSEEYVERLRRRQEDNIRRDLEGTLRVDVNWNQLVEDKTQRWPLVDLRLALKAGNLLTSS